MGPNGKWAIAIDSLPIVKGLEKSSRFGGLLKNGDRHLGGGVLHGDSTTRAEPVPFFNGLLGILYDFFVATVVE